MGCHGKPVHPKRPEAVILCRRSLSLPQGFKKGRSSDRVALCSGMVEWLNVG